MDFSKLYDFYERNILTDCHLILLDDKKNRIEMNIHKIVLSSSSKYFEKLFTDEKFIENNKNTITMHVPDAKIINDIIMNFYDQEINSTNYAPWFHVLESY